MRRVTEKASWMRGQGQLIRFTPAVVPIVVLVTVVAIVYGLTSTSYKRNVGVQSVSQELMSSTIIPQEYFVKS